LDSLFDGVPGSDESSRARHAALACFLSHGDGWRDARGTLGGTFALLSETAPGLEGAKEE